MIETFFIMAQGQQIRWQHPNFPTKHFLPVGEETILTRTLRQLKDKDVLVVCDSEYSNHINIDMIHSLVRPTGGLVQGIWRTLKDYEFDVGVILLGDVVFSNRMLDAILKDDREVGLYGRLGANPITGKEARELFGMRIENSKYNDFMCWAGRAWMKNPHYRLWDVYDNYCQDVLTVEEDYTDDMDNPQEYECRFAKLSGLAVEDDKNWKSM